MSASSARKQDEEKGPTAAESPPLVMNPEFPNPGLAPGLSQNLSFPFLSPPLRIMVQDLVHVFEENYGGSLMPANVAEGLESLSSPDGNSHGSVVIRLAKKPSKIDRVLTSWMHCKLGDKGPVLDIATLSVLMSADSDAPHFLSEFIVTNNSSHMVLIMDLRPRLDLVCYPEHLERVYGGTRLEGLYQQCLKDPDMAQYNSPSQTTRASMSPTALLLEVPARGPESSPKIELEGDGSQSAEGTPTGAQGLAEAGSGDVVGAPPPPAVVDGAGKVQSVQEARLEQLIETKIHPLARQFIDVWVEVVRSRSADVEDDATRACIVQRDRSMLSHQKDLAEGMPRLFGPEIGKNAAETILRALHSEC